MAVTAALLVATAVTATASAFAKDRQAHFQLKISGSQATTWHLSKSGGAGACAATEEMDGDQMIRFHSAGNAAHVISVSQAAHGEPIFSTQVKLDATVERNVESYGSHPIITRSGCAGTVSTPRIPMPCGHRIGTIELALGYSSAAVAQPGGTDPIPLGSSPDRLRLAGINPLFGGGNLLSAYSTCPMLEDPGVPEAQGRLIEAVASVREPRLFARSRAPITIHAGFVSPFKGIGGATGQTVVAYNLTLRRAH